MELTVDRLIELLQRHKEEYSGEAFVSILSGITNGTTSNIAVVPGANTSFVDGKPLEGYIPPILLLPKA